MKWHFQDLDCLRGNRPRGDDSMEARQATLQHNGPLCTDRKGHARGSRVVLDRLDRTGANLSS